MAEPKVSFIVPARDKAHFVGDTVRSVLEQTYSPMEIVLSDQGSTDDTFGILTEMANSYNGPNTVRVVQCPHTELRGMAGLNLHLNWLHEQIEGDLVIMCSADDLNHPDRAAYTVQAWLEHNPSYVGTGVQYLDRDKKWHGEITAYRLGDDETDGWVDPVDNVKLLVGSSASSCWARDLYDKYGPLRGVESQDVLLPFFATLERGLYFVKKQLHAYVRHADPNNTGLGGVLLAAQEGEKAAVTDEEKAEAGKSVGAALETNNYHYTSNYYAILRRLTQMQINITPEVEEALLRKTVEAGNIWAISRDNITMGRVEPMAMRI